VSDQSGDRDRSATDSIKRIKRLNAALRALRQLTPEERRARDRARLQRWRAKRDPSGIQIRE